LVLATVWFVSRYLLYLIKPVVGLLSFKSSNKKIAELKEYIVVSYVNRPADDFS